MSAQASVAYRQCITDNGMLNGLPMGVEVQAEQGVAGEHYTSLGCRAATLMCRTLPSEKHRRMLPSGCFRRPAGQYRPRGSVYDPIEPPCYPQGVAASPRKALTG